MWHVLYSYHYSFIYINCCSILLSSVFITTHTISLLFLQTRNYVINLAPLSWIRFKSTVWWETKYKIRNAYFIFYITRWYYNRPLTLDYFVEKIRWWTRFFQMKMNRKQFLAFIEFCWILSQNQSSLI